MRAVALAVALLTISACGDVDAVAPIDSVLQDSVSADATQPDAGDVGDVDGSATDAADDATPDGPCLTGGGPNMVTGCLSWLSLVGPCYINGQADLAMPLIDSTLHPRCSCAMHVGPSSTPNLGNRSGVEATMSELKRAHGLGKLRVRRMVRVKIQVALKTTACNIKRWLRAAGLQAGPQAGAPARTWATLIVAAFQITLFGRPRLAA